MAKKGVTGPIAVEKSVPTTKVQITPTYLENTPPTVKIIVTGVQVSNAESAAGRGID